MEAEILTLADYLMGRDAAHGAELDAAKRANAEETVSRVNRLLEKLAEAGVAVENNPRTGTPVSSGWRPASVNAATPGAASRSKHMSCQACDLYDPEGEIDGWCMENQHELAAIGLWLEHPSATKDWCHVQIVPPKSGRRVFYP